MEEILYNFLYPQIERGKRDGLKVGITRVARSKAFSRIDKDIETHMFKEGCAEYFKLSDGVREDMFLACCDKVLEDKEGERRENIPTDLTPYVDIKSINERFLFNETLQQFSERTYESWVSLIDLESKKLIEVREAIREYDPYGQEYTARKEIKFEGEMVDRINTYVPPHWALRERIEGVKCPDRIEKFLKHLLPIKEQRESVLDWVANAYQRRCETYLVLNGDKGVGKGVFCLMLEALVGTRNFTLAQDSFGQTGFNSILDSMRIIVLDELKSKKDNKGKPKIHNRLLRYINEYQAIEKKGKDVKGQVKTFNSFVINNNYEDECYLEHDDRRFSVVDLGNKDLKELFSEQEIDELVRDIQDPESDLVAHWGWFIAQRRVKRPPFYTIKGDKFWRLVYASLSSYQQVCVDHFTTSDEGVISLDDLVDHVFTVKETKPKKNTVRSFLQNFKWKDGVLAHVREIEGEVTLINPRVATGEEKVLGDYSLNSASNEEHLVQESDLL